MHINYPTKIYTFFITYILLRYINLTNRIHGPYFSRKVTTKKGKVKKIFIKKRSYEREIRDIARKIGIINLIIIFILISAVFTRGEIIGAIINNATEGLINSTEQTLKTIADNITPIIRNNSNIPVVTQETISINVSPIPPIPPDYASHPDNTSINDTIPQFNQTLDINKTYNESEMKESIFDFEILPINVTINITTNETSNISINESLNITIN